MTGPQTTQLLEGKKSAAAIREEAAAMVQELRAAGTVPGLALVLAAADESAAWYTRAITRAASPTVASGEIVTGSAVITPLAIAPSALRRRSSNFFVDSRKTTPPKSSM